VDVFQEVANNLSFGYDQVKVTIELINTGATVPFIARYRKEVTGMLDETNIRDIVKEHNRLDALNERRAKVLSSLQEQGKLSDELKSLLLTAKTMTELEEIYAPYKTKKETKADKARKLGLEPLCIEVLGTNFKSDLNENFRIFAQKNNIEIDEVKSSLIDLIAERINLDKSTRETSVMESMKSTKINVEIIPKEKRKAKKGYEGQENDETEIINQENIGIITQIKPHQLLALQRAVNRGQIKVKYDIPKEKFVEIAESNFIKSKMKNEQKEIITDSISTCYTRYFKTSLERSVWSNYIETAEKQAISVFGNNLYDLLYQSPLKNVIIMGLDPGIRTGTKVAVIDEKGDVLKVSTVDTKSSSKSQKIFNELIKDFKVKKIVIGNGTGSRDVEKIIVECIKGTSVEYSIVSEVGASVYSASKIAQDEFPDLDVSLRGAISIARRVQDPLGEYIKIDPKSLGIGQYQHDVNQKQLQETLNGVTEDVVNQIGVDVKTASNTLLSYVSGITPSIAKNLVAYRSTNLISNRNQLLKVKGFGSKTFEQSAGFIRIYGGDNPLDNTFVHPESYDFAERILNEVGFTIHNLAEKSTFDEIKRKLKGLKNKDIEKLQSKLNISSTNINEIISSIVNTGIDPRSGLGGNIFRSDVLTLEDLELGMILKGKINNITDFGAFVDIGVKANALIHISQLSNSYVKHPSDIVKIGEIVDVKVLKIDGKRISVSMKALK